MFCHLSHSPLCCFCWGTLHQRLPIHATVLTTLLRCAATCNLFFFTFVKLSPFFHLAAKRFWIQIAPWWTLRVPTQWMWRCKLCEWRHFWCTPLFLTRFLSLWNKGGVSKMQLLTPTTCPTQAYTHRHTQKHTHSPPSLAFIKLPKDVANFIWTLKVSRACSFLLAAVRNHTMWQYQTRGKVKTTI